MPLLFGQIDALLQREHINIGVHDISGNQGKCRKGYSQFSYHDTMVLFVLSLS